MSNSRLVYTSKSGRICPSCQKPIKDCTCKENHSTRASDDIVRIRREVKGRKGKTVTTIGGVPLTNGEIQNLAAELKKKCGTGGSVKDGVIIIQGDHRARLATELEARGFQVKLAGG